MRFIMVESALKKQIIYKGIKISLERIKPAIKQYYKTFIPIITQINLYSIHKGTDWIFPI
ncbi:hypothetical protein EW076_23405 [Escherichia coli]|nr:hypothetical protein RG35_04980 [Escherichia coli]EEY5971196.1 hypothetical protein [Escherichia coli]PAZ69338.1 hypothetical protein APX88_18380 [Escherichia coli]PUB70456.1 hypothetical protein DBZ47_06655 [Escherichia coli]PUD94576.1 hypothetical protein DBX29_04400 [Escherichia coli]